MSFVRFSGQTTIFLCSNNYFIFVMENYCVYFAVRTDILNIIYASFGFKD
jgi:hypothetical protein